MILSILILAIIGFGIALYTYLLERKVKIDATYKPTCDISERISCTKPMLSPYANIFFFSNALVATAFYILVAILAVFDFSKLLLILAIAGVIASCFLAYLLYFKIKSLCLLCTSMYVINVLILILSIWQLYR